MKKLLFTFMMAILCFGMFAQNVIIDSPLRDEMNKRSDNELIDIVVIMKSQYDRLELDRRASCFATRAERREFVVNELKEFAAASQYDLRHSLAEMQRNGLATAPMDLWLSNALRFKATKGVINELALRHDIEIIGFNEEHCWIPDGEVATPASNTREITQNVIQVNADDVWATGNTGQGVVVAVIDSGVRYTHVDVADHLWDGGSEFPNHGWDIYNNDNDPMDDMGHGSHCAGTVCGDGTAGSQTGMAPDATLMCVKVLNANGNGGAAEIAGGIQWAVEHGCDLFSMSLGIANSSVEERTLLRYACEDALAAGVVAAIAAGNEGQYMSWFPIPNNVRVPGSCPPPYIDPEQAVNPGKQTCSVCVGAVDYNDNAADFTSHGPVTWTNTEFGDYPYNPGIGLIRPDICAPGVDIKSLDYTGNNGYTLMSGTSMATPCTAGVMCLMLSKNINITPSDVCRILEETCVPLSETKSNVTGFGRIDALAAVEAIQAGALACDSYVINDTEGNNDHKLNPGESVLMSVTLTNVSEDAVDGATVRLTTDDENVTIIDDSSDLPHFGVGESHTIENAFAFSVSNAVVGRQTIRLIVEIDEGGEEPIIRLFSVVVYADNLVYGTTVVLNDDNGNGLLEPGENADLRILVDNDGNEIAFGVNGVLSSEYEYITINESEGDYGTIGAEMMAFADFNVTLSADAPADFTIPFVMNMVDANGKETMLDFNYKNACNVIFNLHDSYGVGWNGASMHVEYSDGTPAEDMTISSGNSATYSHELATGCEVTVTWHSGSWDSGCSFDITYDDGTVIYSHSGSMSSPYTFTVNCAGGGSVPEFCQPVRNLTYSVDGADVTLAWEAPEEGDPTVYEVYRGTILLQTTTGLSFTETVAEEGFYDYCVYAVYDDCQSEFVCTEVEVSLCQGVNNLDYTLDGLTLNLTWEAPDDPTNLVEYVVILNGEEQTRTNELSYQTELNSGDYDVCVSTVFAECEKNTCLFISICEAPNDLTYLAEGQNVTLTWEMEAPAESYNIYADGELIGTSDTNSFTAEFASGQTHVCVEVNGDCEPIQTCTEVCVVMPVSELTYTTTDADGSHFTWQPADAENIAGYDVMLNGELVAQPTEAEAALTLVEGHNEICVVAKSVFGCESTPTCTELEVCGLVANLDYTFVGNAVNFTWEGNAAEYEVYVDAELKGTVTEPAYSLELENGTHAISVMPVVEGCETIPACLALDFNFVAPSNLVATDVREGKIALAWDAIETANSYILYRDGTQIAEATETVFADTEMALNATYQYAVAAIYEKGVSVASDALSVAYYMGVGENASRLSIFPNPTSDDVTIQCEGMSRIEVYSIDGKLIQTIEVEDDSYQLKDLEQGTYTLRITNGNETFVRKVVKM